MHYMCEKSNIKRVAAYIRVGNGKIQQLSSYLAQASFYTEKINNNPSWVFAGVYSDEAASKEGYRALITACEEGEVDLVIIKSISSFGNNVEDVLSAIRDFKALGVDVLFEKENINTKSPGGELVLSLLALLVAEKNRLLTRLDTLNGDATDNKVNEKTCMQCGRRIKQTAGRREKKFCSDACRMTWWHEHPEGMYKKSAKAFECAQCGKRFSAYGIRKYCSHECFVQARFGDKDK